jgi:flavodoxin
MKSILIYDSLYGNTAKIAEAIANVLREQGEVAILKVGEAQVEQLIGVDWLIVGSPTQQFRPTAGLKKLLGLIPDHGLDGIKVAAFDTRLTNAQIEKSPPLPIFVKMFGFAAGRIAKQLRAKGGKLVGLPEGFLVGDMEGPLVEGELERATEWARSLFA